MDQKILTEIQESIEKVAQQEGVSVPELCARVQDALNKTFDSIDGETRERIRQLVSPKDYYATPEEVLYTFRQLVIMNRQRSKMCPYPKRRLEKCAISRLRFTHPSQRRRMHIKYIGTPHSLQSLYPDDSTYTREKGLNMRDDEENQVAPD